ncbi:VOC family protein [Sphingomonas sp. DBB INV C78]|uniref:VOC family protein n=1 Tax=Sphingomonas sp. DBB INV C78 TaxID=3349434 RepID=UPI0036D2A896
MISIQAIDHVVLRIVDLDGMIRFYTEVLGARLEKVQAEIGLWQLRVGTALIDLVPVTGKLGAMAPRRRGKGATSTISASGWRRGMAKRFSRTLRPTES